MITLVVIVCFAAVWSYAAWAELNHARAAANQQAVTEATTAANAISTGWALLESQVSAVASNPSVSTVIARPAGCRLNFSFDLLPHGHIDLVTPGGQVVCSSFSLPSSGASQAGAPWLATAASTAGLFQSAQFRDAVTGQEAVAIGEAIHDSAARPIGAVVIVAPLAGLAGELSRVYSDERSYRFALVDTQSAAVLSASGTSNQAAGQHNPITSGGYLYGYKPVPSTKWVVFAGVRTTEALGPTRSVLLRAAALAGIALLVMLALLLVIRRRIATPLRNLTRVVAGNGPNMDAALASVGGTTEVAHLAAAFQEMSKGRAAYEVQLSHQALHDPLTGLPNRALLADRLKQALVQSNRLEEPVTVLVIDVDRFKLVNDAFGHSNGDRVLLDLAARLAERLGPGDTLGRFGGDEFVVVCARLTNPAAAFGLADLLITAAAAPLEVADQVIRPSLSIGIAIAGPSSTAEQLLRDADAAMYQAKQRGGARCELFNPAQRRVGMEQLALETELRAGIERGELKLVYQPMIDLNTGRMIGAEALMRWEHPALRSIPPTTFIPIAEQTGLIRPLGLLALDTATRQASEWYAQGYDLTVSVNLSAHQVGDPHLTDQISAALSRYGCPPDRLCLELTESALMIDPERAPAALAAIKALGLHLSVDDFGTGYSSLAYLQRFPVDEIKIDRTFTTNLTHAEQDRSLVAAIIAMSDALDLRTVAEGVETAEQADHLRRMGCQHAQGYLFARPAPADVITASILDGSIAPTLLAGC